MRFVVYVCIVLWPLVCQAQDGHYFLSHYTPGDERIDHAAFDVAQGTQGVLYFATRTGVLQFDGRDWELLPGHGAVYAIEINGRGDIFWAGAHGFGEVVLKADGSREVTLLSEPDQRDFYQILVIGERTYFLNDKTVFLYDGEKAVSKISSDERTGSFTVLFDLFGKPYAGTEQGRVFSLDEDGPTHVLFNRSQDLDVVFASQLDGHYLVGTSDNRLFLCHEDRTLREIVLQESQYINASVVVSGSWVNNRLIALGSLRGGVIFINPMSGKTEEIINYHTGLPDNEIFSLMTDQSGNIWVTHDYGFTRIAPFLPFRSFSHYEGLSGNLLCAMSHNDEVYAGTSLGLYKLVREETYDEIVYYVYVRETEDTPETPLKSGQDAGHTAQAAEEDPEKKRGFLRFLKKDRTDDEAEPKPQVKKTGRPGGVQPGTIRKVKKTGRILRSAQFAYKKVTGIEAKVTHLAEVNGKLIAAGLGGVFEINDQTSSPILEEPVRFIFSTEAGQLVASTYADRVRTFRYDSAQWRQTHLVDDLNDKIAYMFEGQPNELWLFGQDQFYRVSIAGDSVAGTHRMEFSTPNFSKTTGMTWENEVVLTNPEGFFRFDRRHNKLVRIDSLPAPKTYFASRGNMWYQDEHTWHVLGRFNLHRNAYMLNICKDIRYIASDVYADNIWVITGANELYKFIGAQPEGRAVSPYPLYLKAIRQADQKIALDKKLKVDEEAGRLTFDVVQPAYTSATATEYRYLLAGLNDDWSVWSYNNRIDFPYLPPGHYTLSVQSRDIFGVVQEMDPLPFNVQPPYWKSPWFYAMQFTVFALLVILSLKLSVRYRIVSRILSLLTIILLIEFIQTIAGYTFSTGSSPVIDFMVQVLVAFMILPVEGFLRDLMLRSMSPDGRLFKVIKELDRKGKGRK